MGDLTSNIESDIFKAIMITVTDSAVKQLKNLIEENPIENAAKGIRLFIQAGGCCKDPHYGMALDKQRDGDEIFDRDGVQFFIDSASTDKLKGSIVDYYDGPEGVGLRQVMRSNLLGFLARQFARYPFLFYPHIFS